MRSRSLALPSRYVFLGFAVFSPTTGPPPVGLRTRGLTGIGCSTRGGGGVGSGTGTGVNSIGGSTLMGAPVGGIGGCSFSNSAIGMSGSTIHGGTTTGTFFLSVPTVMCGQLRPLKLSMTSWEYWSWKKFGVPLTSSIQKVQFIKAEMALGPMDPRARKAVLAVPPPVTGAVGVVEI